MTWSDFKQYIEATGVVDDDVVSIGIHSSGDPFAFLYVKDVENIEVFTHGAGKAVSVFPRP